MNCVLSWYIDYWATINLFRVCRSPQRKCTCAALGPSGSRCGSLSPGSRDEVSRRLQFEQSSLKLHFNLRRENIAGKLLQVCVALKEKEVWVKTALLRLCLLPLPPRDLSENTCVIQVTHRWRGKSLGTERWKQVRPFFQITFSPLSVWTRKWLVNVFAWGVFNWNCACVCVDESSWRSCGGDMSSSQLLPTSQTVKEFVCTLT